MFCSSSSINKAKSNEQYLADREIYAKIQGFAEKIISLSQAELKRIVLQDTIAKTMKLLRSTPQGNARKQVAKFLQIVAKYSRLVQYLDADQMMFSEVSFVEWATKYAMAKSSEWKKTQSPKTPDFIMYSPDGTPTHSHEGMDSPALLRRAPISEGSSEDDIFSMSHRSASSSLENLDDQEPILCRICERPVPQQLIDNHTKQCVQVATARSKTTSCNSALRKLAATAETEYQQALQLYYAVTIHL